MRRVRPTSSPDYVFASVLVLIVIFGLVMLASASSDVAKVEFGDGYYYMKRQVLNGVLFGLVGFLTGVFVYFRKLEKLALVLLVINIILLLLVFTPLGVTVKGATRWLTIGGLTFQPSEFLKFTFIFYIASWVARNRERKKSLAEGFIPFLFLMGIVAIILLKQPATTTAVIIFSAVLIMYFLAGARFRFLVAILLLGALGLASIIYLTPYRMERVMTFLNPESVDKLNEGYHISQTLTAIGSGGIFGVGYGRSTTKLRFLPEPIGDSIFAVIGEELGFVGASVLILLFFVLVWRAFMIARSCSDDFGRLIAIGFGSLVGLQVFINIGAVSGVVPLTGVPLPFVSFGGTALAVFLTMGGVILNVSRYRR